MGREETQLQRRRQIGEWFETPLGRSLEAFEANRLRSVLPNLYGTVAVQIGRLGRLDLMDACNASTRIVLDLDARADRVGVRALPEALPFDSGQSTSCYSRMHSTSATNPIRCCARWRGCSRRRGTSWCSDSIP
jgi:hypothetical protein